MYTEARLRHYRGPTLTADWAKEACGAAAWSRALALRSATGTYGWAAVLKWTLVVGRGCRSACRQINSCCELTVAQTLFRPA